MPFAMRLRASAVACLAAAVLAAGCGKQATRVSGPAGDNAGEHLLVFRSDRLGAASHYDILLYDLDQSGYRSLSGLNTASDESEPCLSNDGNLVCFASDRPGAGGSGIYVYERLSQALLSTPSLNTAANETHPRFAFDSVELLFARDSAGVKRLRMYTPLGDSLIRLPGIDSPGASDDEAPAPDLHGNRIAFQSNRSGRTHVYVWDSGTGVLAIPDLVSDSSDIEPALSADGRWLAFASNRSGGAGGYDVYLYDLAGRVFVPLVSANTAGDERHPGVSADGNILYFQSRPDAATKWDLWQYSRFSSSRTQPAGLPSADGDDVQPYLRWR